jgi:hypothetical protein
VQEKKKDGSGSSWKEKNKSEKESTKVYKETVCEWKMKRGGRRERKKGSTHLRFK